MNSDDVRMARIILAWLVEPGARIVHELVTTYGPTVALDLILAGEVADRRLRSAVAARRAAEDPRRVAELALTRAARVGARLIVPEDTEWPAQLDDLILLDGLVAAGRLDRDARPPLGLWLRGDLDLAPVLHQSVAVVGARAASAYGVHVATELGYGLADRGWTVVSGGAYGIDAAAHRGALAGGGPTVAVLACGVDRPYPAGNTALFDRVAESGLLVSEWPPGAEPHRHRFIIRNRVIAAATAGTVLVEAAARSGAVSTTRRALALHRPAMVVPGPVTSPMSAGCHHLVRTEPDARLVTSVAEVLEEVGRIGVDLAPPVRGPSRPRDGLDPETTQLLEAMPLRRAVGPAELAAMAGVGIRTTLRRLSLLVELGLVDEAAGAYRLRPAARLPPAGGPAGVAP